MPAVNGSLTTHVLDTTTKRPAAGIAIGLHAFGWPLFEHSPTGLRIDGRTGSVERGFAEAAVIEEIVCNLQCVQHAARRGYASCKASTPPTPEPC